MLMQLILIESMPVFLFSDFDLFFFFISRVFFASNVRIFLCLCWDLNFFLHSEFKLRSVDWITPACIVPTQETQQPSL